MLRLGTMLVMGIALGYCLFFTRLEGRSIASHLNEVVHSPLVQQKLHLMGREGGRALRQSLADNLPRQLPELAERLRPPEPPGGTAAPETSLPEPLPQLPSLSAPRPRAQLMPSPARPTKTPLRRPESHSTADRQALEQLVQDSQKEELGASRLSAPAAKKVNRDARGGGMARD